MQLGKCIKVALVQREMTGEDLAKELGVTKATVSHYITTNNCSMVRLQEMCKVFNITAVELFKLGGEHEQHN